MEDELNAEIYALRMIIKGIIDTEKDPDRAKEITDQLNYFDSNSEIFGY